METVRLSSKGQIVIPKGIRDAHKFVPGTQFIISLVGEEIRLLPAPAYPKMKVEQGLGILHKKGRIRAKEADVKNRIGAMLQTSEEDTKR